MRIFGLTITRADRDATSLFGGDPIAVDKAYGLPDGASVNEAGSARLSAIAAGQQQLGSGLPAQGVRPNPGVLPSPQAESDADPLRFQLPWGGNIAYTPRSGYGTPFSLLRGLAATSPVIALCIQCRKDQMASLDWDFAAKDKKATGSAIDAQLARARAIFEKPDGRRPHKSWIQLLVDEALTLDAVSIYKRPTRRGAGKLAKDAATKLAAEDIWGYEILDGSTIKVLLDPSGDVPPPPSIAYRQIIYGAPVTGGDLTTDQLMYRPKTERTWTPYGMSPIEAALLIVTADLNRAIFNLAYYSEGNIPEALVGVPDTWSPKQISQFNEYWNLVLKGDPKNRAKLRFVVQTMAKTVHEFKKPDFTTAYDLWLLKMQCACFGVTPSEIGFTDDVNKATSKTQGDVNQRRGVKPMANFIKALHDEILVAAGLDGIETTWSGGEGEDALTQAKIIDLNLRNGRVSLDEIRAVDGNPTIGAGPAIYTGTGLVFIEDAIAQSEAAGVLDTAGADEPDEPLPAPAKAPAAPAAAAIAQEAELKKYHTVATKAVKAGKPVPVFTSAVIPAPVLARLSRALETADSLDDVQKAFGMVRKEQRLSATQKKHQARMTSKLTAVLAAEGQAFAKHLEAGL